MRQIVGGIQRRLPRTVDRNDLLSAGMAGLWQATCRATVYDEGFEWYVRTRIRGAVLDELRHQDWLPRRMRADAAEGEHLPSIVLYGDEADLGSAEHRLGQTTEEELSDLLVNRKELRVLLEAELAKLPDRQQYVLAGRYFRGQKFKDLAAVLGISEPRVFQIATKGLAQLRAGWGLVAYRP